MENNIIEKALNFAKEFFDGEASGHDYFHTFRVYKNAEMLIDKIPHADREICLLGAILHDVDDDKISPETHKSKDNARRFLNSVEYAQEKIELLCKIIDDVSFSQGVKPESLEGQIVQDADRLDAIGAIGIARTFAFGGNKGREIYNPDIKPDLTKTKEQYKNSKPPTINHFYEKLLLLEDLMNTDVAKQFARKRTEFMENYLDEFFAEWNGER